MFATRKVYFLCTYILHQFFYTYNETIVNEGYKKNKKTFGIVAKNKRKTETRHKKAKEKMQTKKKEYCDSKLFP